MLTETELLPELWSDLPETIWQVIFSFLPFSSLIKFRRVCKGWNKLITTPSFGLKCAKQPSAKGVPVLSPARGMTGAVYRCLLPDSEIPSQTGPWEKVSLGDGAESRRYLIACDGGLMLFDTDHPDRFVVCNPLTRRYRDVECPSKAASSSVGCVVSDTARVGRVAGLVANRETGDYKLVIVSLGEENGEGRNTCIYDSASRAWTIGAPVISSAIVIGSPRYPRSETSETFFSPGAVTCKGSIYCVLAKYELQQKDDWTWRVAKYHVDSDCWTYTANLVGRTILFAESTRSGLPTALPDIQLVTVGDRIIIVSKVRTSIWLPRLLPRSIFYNSFAVLWENETFMEFVGHDLPRNVIRKLLKKKEGGPYTGLPCTFAGFNGCIYFTHQHELYNNTEDVEGDVRVVRVGIFRPQDPESYYFLPDYLPDTGHSSTLVRDLDSTVRMKIWVLEPSLIACV